ADAYSSAINHDGQLLHDVLTPMLAVGFTRADVAPFLERVSGAWRALVEGQLLEAEGQHEAAVAAYEEAIATGMSTMRPAALGTAHAAAARCLITLGHRDRARAHATQGAELLAHWSGWRVDELRAVQ